MKQAIPPLQTMLTHPPLEALDSRLISPRVIRCGQQLKPNGIQTEPAQAKHPLQRDGKVSTPFRILGGKTATNKDRHRQRIARSVFLSSGTETVI